MSTPPASVAPAVPVGPSAAELAAQARAAEVARAAARARAVARARAERRRRIAAAHARALEAERRRLEVLASRAAASAQRRKRDSVRDVPALTGVELARSGRATALRASVAAASGGLPVLEVFLLGGMGVALLLFALAAVIPLCCRAWPSGTSRFLLRQRAGLAVYGAALLSSTALVFLLVSSTS